MLKSASVMAGLKIGRNRPVEQFYTFEVVAPSGETLILSGRLCNERQAKHHAAYLLRGYEKASAVHVFLGEKDSDGPLFWTKCRK